MPNLSYIAQSVFIGNSNVWNFLNYAVNRPIGGTGGVLGLSNRNDFVANNLVNNRTHGAGWSRRVSNDEIPNSIVRVVTKTEDGESHFTTGQNMTELFIGDLYRQDETFVTGRRFITTNDFTELNTLIRANFTEDDGRLRARLWGPGKRYGIGGEEAGGYFTYTNNNSELLDLEDGRFKIDNDFKVGRYFLRHRIGDDYYFPEERDREGQAYIMDGSNVTDGVTVGNIVGNLTSRLMNATNRVFSNLATETLINRFHTSNFTDGELENSFKPWFGISRGRNLIRAEYEGAASGDKSTGYDNPYCRVWTAHYQYARMKNRIRPFMEDGNFMNLERTQSNYGNLRPNNGAKRLSEFSVLKPNGFLKITPSFDAAKTDGSQRGYGDNIKNYMFSIENLAWRDIIENSTTNALSAEQKGPNNGRIMWFPPYGLKFSENINVNWTPNTFIGRGEEILTYVNTVRSGTLDFILLIDHPAVINKWRGTSGEVDDKERKQQDLLRFFAGCGNLNDAIAPAKPEKTEPVQTVEPSKEPKPVRHTRDIAYVIFFPNNLSGAGQMSDTSRDEIYQVIRDYNINSGAASVRDEKYSNQIVAEWNKISYGEPSFSKYAERIRGMIFDGDQNVEINFLENLELIDSYFSGDKIFGMDASSCEITGVDIGGCASSHGYEDYNLELCENRKNYLKNILKENAVNLNPADVTYNDKAGKIINIQNTDGRANVNDIDAKLARAAYAIIHLAWNEDNKASNDTPASGATVNNAPVDAVEDIVETITGGTNITGITEDLSEEYTYDNEYLYFSELKADSPLVYRNLVDKIRYFSPAYHSITPEGFNARLTFLQQCTRQGPTNSVSGGQAGTDSSDYLKYAGNLSFGRAPYCILRIGDFFNTKICIESMSISYDNGNGVQWDLNPEGAGVQPMFANVSITFKFFGGQDISSPIERLQNAVTSNYYANASVYDRHADTSEHYYDIWEGQDKEKEQKANNSSK